MTDERSCPCGSKKDYAECCAPLHRGARRATTAVELMRARYSAFVRQEIDFVLDTAAPEGDREERREHIERWSRESTWHGLEIIDTEAGGESDDEGVVEFIAFYDDPDGDEVEHHERAFFRREEGEWIFVDGVPARQDPYVREEPKIGRNDPCPCGSGKKYKKCCGKAA